VKTKSKPKSRGKGNLPTKPVLEELERLRATCREIVARYLAGVEDDITSLADVVALQTAGTEASKDRVADLRDMLMLLRGVEVKPAKGRRRDLKKIENVLEELSSVTGRW
jgi:hypothetical protein